ncbi:hypothetical protein ANTQUA_LOCUS5317 [Anthophora quadrimaculata]
MFVCSPARRILLAWSRGRKACKSGGTSFSGTPERNFTRNTRNLEPPAAGTRCTRLVPSVQGRSKRGQKGFRSTITSSVPSLNVGILRHSSSNVPHDRSTFLSDSKRT